MALYLCQSFSILKSMLGDFRWSIDSNETNDNTWKFHNCHMCEYIEDRNCNIFLLIAYTISHILTLCRFYCWTVVVKSCHCSNRWMPCGKKLSFCNFHDGLRKENEPPFWDLVFWWTSLSTVCPTLIEFYLLRAVTMYLRFRKHRLLTLGIFQLILRHLTCCLILDPYII